VTLPTKVEKRGKGSEDKENVDGNEGEGVVELRKGGESDKGNEEDETGEQREEEDREGVLEVGSKLNLKFADPNRPKVKKEDVEYNLDEPESKPVIEVLSSSNEIGVITNTSKEVAGDETKKSTAVEKTRKSFDFKNQETFTNYFFISHLPGYDKDNAQIAYLKDQILVKYEDKSKVMTLWIQLEKGYNKEKTSLNFVTDYIVLNIQKQEDAFWEKGGWSLKDDDEEFERLLKEYNSTVSEISTNKEDVVQEEVNESVAQPNEEIRKKEEMAQEEQSAQQSQVPQENIIDNKLLEKKQLSINFINYDRKSFAFELD